MKDVFICHASEDKESIVYPLVSALKENGLTYWLDSAEINWGDSLIEKINEGLSNSKYVVVILSDNFLSKRWPQRELNSILSIEATTGEVKILPLIVGDALNIISEFTLLSDKTYIKWNNNPKEIIDALSSRLNISKAGRQIEDESSPKFNIPLPVVKRNISQREKDVFIKKVYGDISKYFEEGLLRLENHHDGIETDYTEIHKLKFISKIYLDGEIKNECKIWMGGSLSNGVSYSEGSRIDINNDNSTNDWLSVEDDGSTIFLKPSGMYMFPGQGDRELKSGLDAAEYFWRRFISALE